MTGLDAVNEAEVTEALRRLTAGRTTFLISHDPATVADADVVVRLQAGRVVARGRPEEVLGRRGRVVHLPGTGDTEGRSERTRRADAG